MIRLTNRRHSYNLPHIPLLFLFLLLCLLFLQPSFVYGTLPIDPCPNNCFNRSIQPCSFEEGGGGTFGRCQCRTGSFGKDCSLISENLEEQIFQFTIEGRLGQIITQEWFIIQNEVRPYLHLRWCHNLPDRWFGGIFNVGPNGMAPSSGSTADVWTMWVTPTQQVYISDWSSRGQTKPQLDNQQDLTIINGWRNATHQCGEFQRLLDTMDTGDIILSSHIGSPVRFMWTHGLTSLEDSRLTTSPDGLSRHPSLTMHGLLGHTDQLKIDFVKGSVEFLTSGVRWTNGYWYGFGLGLGILFLPFGFIFQRHSFKRSKLGRWLRKRPFKELCGGKDGGRYRTSQPTSHFHRYTLQLFPTLRNFSYQEWFGFIIYLIINLVVILTSLQDYEHVARGSMYVFGHLLSIHLALAILPVSRNSFLLSLCNIGYDLAITWHRRVNMMTMLWLLLHLISMIIYWGGGILIESSSTQFGMGSWYGSLSGICLLIMFGTSIEWMRRYYWETFKYIHISAAMIGYVFALMHSYNLRWLLILPGLIYLLDLIIRFVLDPYRKFGGRITMMPSYRNDNIVGDSDRPLLAPSASASASAAVAAAPSSSPEAIRSNHSHVIDSASSLSHTANTNTRARIVRLTCLGRDQSPSSHSQVLILTIVLEDRYKTTTTPSSSVSSSSSSPTRTSSLVNPFTDLPKPGGHLNLCVPEISRFECHPFTISEARFQTMKDDLIQQLILTLHIQVITRSFEERLKLCCSEESLKHRPTWTQQLYQLATQCLSGTKSDTITFDHDFSSADIEASHSSTPSSSSPRSPPPFSLLLDGPYYSLNLPLFDYPILVLVGGGIGITPIMSLLSHYIEACYSRVEKDDDEATNVGDDHLPKCVYLIWSLRSEDGFYTWFPQSMSRLAAFVASHPMRIKVYLNATRKDTIPSPPATASSPQPPSPPSSARVAAAGVATPPLVVHPRSKKEQFRALSPMEAQGLTVGSPTNDDDDCPDGEGDTQCVNDVERNGIEMAASSMVEVDASSVHDDASSSSPLPNPTIAAAAAPLPFPIHSGRFDFTSFFTSLPHELIATSPSSSSSSSFDPVLTSADVCVFTSGPIELIEMVESEAERNGCHYTHEKFQY